eukprot:scaffold181446_cov49-Attheya_sp.AAC.1
MKMLIVDSVDAERRSKNHTPKHDSVFSYALIVGGCLEVQWARPPAGGANGRGQPYYLVISGLLCPPDWRVLGVT